MELNAYKVVLMDNMQVPLHNAQIVIQVQINALLANRLQNAPNVCLVICYTNTPTSANWHATRDLFKMVIFAEFASHHARNVQLTICTLVQAAILLAQEDT